MKVYNAPQGSEEWHKARAGVITASMFATIRDTLKTGPNKGGYKAAALNYAFQVAIERISGEPLDEGFETFSMRRGKALEPEARKAHGFLYDLDIKEAGFITTDCGRFGASADGLINENGGSEYKCLIAPERLRGILIDQNIDEFQDQIQGGMWISEREWWHFGLYCPALSGAGRDLTIFPVPRDEDFIAGLQSDLERFDELVEQYREKLLKDEAPKTLEGQLKASLDQTAEGIF